MAMPVKYQDDWNPAFLIVRDKCAFKSEAYQCNNEFRYNWEPCHTKKGILCRDGYVLTNGNCSYQAKLSDSLWKCGDSFIQKTEACEHQGRQICPEEHCYNVETRGCNKTNHHGAGGVHNCGGRCFSVSKPCGGKCPGGRVKFNMTCHHPDQLWRCAGHHQPLSQPCTLTDRPAVCPLGRCLGNGKISQHSWSDQTTTHLVIGVLLTGCF